MNSVMWTQARLAGLPTASPDDLDGDVIPAAQAILAAGSEDIVIVATDNVAHLARLVNEGTWETIIP